MAFSVKNIPDLTGKVIVITGGNSGIGKVTATETARKNARVILACRNKEKTLPVIEEIKKETNNDQVEFMELDLSSLKSVDNFANEYIQRDIPLHILINNAGIMAPPFSLTADGIESQFGTNHIGHFHLTNKLLPILEKSAPSRIVNLSSLMHTAPYTGGVVFDKINDKEFYSPWKAYGQSKLCNILFTKALAKRLESKQILVNAVHPGYVKTDLQRNLSNLYGPIGAFFGKIGHFFALSPLDGSLTSLYVATSPEIEEKNYRGQYFVPIAKLAQTSDYGNNSDLAEKLWEFSEKLVNEKLGQSSIPQTSEKEESQD